MPMALSWPSIIVRLRLHTPVDGRRGIGHLRIFRTVEQTVVAPAAHGFRHLRTRRGQEARRTEPSNKQQKNRTHVMPPAMHDETLRPILGALQRLILRFV